MFSEPAVLKKSDFNYDLPPELIAQAPLAERTASRLLVVPPAPAAFQDLHVRDLDTLLQPGDLLIFNNTRVIPARLFGTKATGGKVEILIERLLGEHDVRAQVGASKSPKAGSFIDLEAGGQAEVLGRDGGCTCRACIPTTRPNTTGPSWTHTTGAGGCTAPGATKSRWGARGSGFPRNRRRSSSSPSTGRLG